jgi:hypothetical protein
MDKQGGYLKIKRDLLTVEDFDVSFINDIFTLLASDNPGQDRSGTFSYENNIITKTSAVDGYNLVLRSNEEASGDFSLEININTDGAYMFGMGADPFDSGVSLYPNHGIHLQLSTRNFWETTEASSNGTGIDFSSQPNSFAGYSFRFERISGNLKVFRKEPLGSSFIQIYDYGTVNGPLYFEYVCWTSGSQLEIVSASGFSIPSQNSITSFTASGDSTGTFSYVNNTITKTSVNNSWDLAIKSDQVASGDFSLEVNINVAGQHFFGMGYDPIAVGTTGNTPEYGVYTDIGNTLKETNGISFNASTILAGNGPSEGDSLKWKRVSGNLTLNIKRSGESSFSQIFDYGAVSEVLYFQSQPNSSGAAIEIISSTGFSIPTTTTTTVTWDEASSGYGVYDVSNGGISGTSSSVITQYGIDQASGPCYIEFTPQAFSGRNYNIMGIAMTNSVESTTPSATYAHALAFGSHSINASEAYVNVYSGGGYDAAGVITYAGDGSEVFRIEILEDRVEYSKNGVVFFTDDQSKAGDLNGVFSGHPPYSPYFRVSNEWHVSDVKISGFDEE